MRDLQYDISNFNFNSTILYSIKLNFADKKLIKDINSVGKYWGDRCNLAEDLRRRK